VDGLSSPAHADHRFGQHEPAAGERRTRVVAAVTALAMAAEVVAGIAFGSMALLADGLHMGSHATALGLSAFAYAYTRRHAADPRFSFGTGKVNALAAFASAVLLAVFSAAMAAESLRRFVAPVSIDFDHAVLVALAGLFVNAVCLLVLRGAGHPHGHGHDDHPGHDHGHDIGHGRGEEHDHDLNLRSAVIHVLADALTSVLAIGALLAGKHGNQAWLDPAMGIAGAVLVIRWSLGLLRDSARILLDMQAPSPVVEAVRRAVEGSDGDRATDLHVWAIGPGLYAASLEIHTTVPRAPSDYRARIPAGIGIVHATIEVTLRESGSAKPAVAPVSWSGPTHDRRSPGEGG
jgi:cation diffusion facilitator family transporter